MEKNKEKKKSGINIFNILLILFVLALIAAAVYFLVIRKDSTATDNDLTQIEYVIEVKGVRNELLGKVKEGDNIVEAVSKNNIGKVKSVETTNYYVEEVNKATQELVMSEYPDYSNLIITISAEGTEGDMGYDINGCTMSVGKYVNSRFPEYECVGYCISVLTAEADS